MYYGYKETSFSQKNVYKWTENEFVIMSLSPKKNAHGVETYSLKKNFGV